MGLRSVLANAALTTVRATGDIAVSANYEAFASASYNASTDTQTATYTTTAVTVIFTNFSIREIDGQMVKPEDKKALLPSTSLASAPTANDRITTDASANVWQVVGIRSDPADALYTLQVRRP